MTETASLAHVVLPVAGRVHTVLVKIGDFVQQGQPLLTLESADIDAAVSSFQQAQAAVTQAKSALAKGQMDLDRQRDLFEHGAVPQKEVYNAQAVTVQAQAAVEQAQSVVQAHEAITLSQDDFAAFLDALDTPHQANPALQRAFARHAKDVP